MECVVNSLFRNKLKVLMVVISCYFLSVSIIHAADESQDKSNNNEEKVLDEIIFDAPKVELRDRFNDFMPLPTTKFKVNSQDIANTNAVTIEDTVRYSPNIEVRRRYIGDNNSVVSMRGNGNFQTARHMVYVDGFPLHSMLQTRWNGAPQWNFVAPEETESVTITYGPFSPKYSGNAMGGVIDIETRQPYQEEWALKTTGWIHDWTHFENEGTSLGYKTFFSYGNKQDKLSYYMFFNRLEGFVQPSNLQEDTSTSSGSSGTAVTGAFRFMDTRSRDSIGFADDGEEKVEHNILKMKADYEFSDSFKVRGMVGFLIRRAEQLNVENYLRDSTGAKVWGGSSNTDMSIGGRTFQVKASNFNVTTRDKQDLMLGLGASGKLGAGWNYDAVLSSYIKLDDTFRSSDENPSDPNYDKSGSLTQFQDTGWQLLDVKFNKNNFMSKSDLKFEGGYHYDHARMETIKWSIPDWENSLKNEGNFSSSTGGQTDTHAVHANLGWDFKPKWDLQLGARMEAWRSFNGYEHESEGEIGGHDHKNEQAFSPKLSIGYKPSSEWEYQFSLARATRFAIPEEMFSNIDDYDDNNVSNPGLKPEVGNHLTFVAGHYKPKATTKVNLFFDYINDTIFNDTSDNVSTFVNIDLVRTMGVELVLKRKDFLISKHDFSFNTAFTDAKILFHPGNPVAHGNDLPRVPDTRIKLQSVYHFFDHWDGMVALNWQDDAFGRVENDDPLDGSGGQSEYLFLDIKTNYRHKNFTLSSGITNLTDETAWTGPHQYPNRTFVTDLSWKY